MPSNHNLNDDTLSLLTIISFSLNTLEVIFNRLLEYTNTSFISEILRINVLFTLKKTALFKTFSKLSNL